MNYLGITTEALARDFIYMHPRAELGSRSANGRRRVVTEETGEKLDELQSSWSAFMNQPEQATHTIPVLSPGIKDPIPCVPCQKSHDQPWADHPGTIFEHLNILKGMAVGGLPPAPVSKGSGIVYVGGGKYWPGIVVGVKLLREIGCSLPVQVWHREQEPVRPEDVDGLDVTIVNTSAHAQQNGGARILGGWEQKLWAISHCGLNRILYLDADAYCVADPTEMIRSFAKPFTFWHDLGSCEKNVKWDKVWPVGASGVPTVQGGQLLINVPEAWRLVCLAHWMNQHSDFYYKHMFGDQDTWRVALAAIGDTELWECLGPAPWEHPAFVIPVDGQKMIVHRCRGKLFDKKALPPRYAQAKGISVKFDNLPMENRVFEVLGTLIDL